MVMSEIVKIKYTNDNLEIENALKSQGIDPLRWAIVAVNSNELLVSVSYEA